MSRSLYTQPTAATAHMGRTFNFNRVESFPNLFLSLSSPRQTTPILGGKPLNSSSHSLNRHSRNDILTPSSNQVMMFSENPTFLDTPWPSTSHNRFQPIMHQPNYQCSSSSPFEPSQGSHPLYSSKQLIQAEEVMRCYNRAMESYHAIRALLLVLQGRGSIDEGIESTIPQLTALGVHKHSFEKSVLATSSMRTTNSEPNYRLTSEDKEKSPFSVLLGSEAIIGSNGLSHNHSLMMNKQSSPQIASTDLISSKVSGLSHDTNQFVKQIDRRGFRSNDHVVKGSVYVNDDNFKVSSGCFEPPVPQVLPRTLPQATINTSNQREQASLQHAPPKQAYGPFDTFQRLQVTHASYDLTNNELTSFKGPTCTSMGVSPTDQCAELYALPPYDIRTDPLRTTKESSSEVPRTMRHCVSATVLSQTTSSDSPLTSESLVNDLTLPLVWKNCLATYGKTKSPFSSPDDLKLPLMRYRSFSIKQSLCRSFDVDNRSVSVFRSQFRHKADHQADQALRSETDFLFDQTKRDIHNMAMNYSRPNSTVQRPINESGLDTQQGSHDDHAAISEFSQSTTQPSATTQNDPMCSNRLTRRSRSEASLMYHDVTIHNPRYSDNRTVFPLFHKNWFLWKKCLFSRDLRQRRQIIYKAFQPNETFSFDNQTNLPSNIGSCSVDTVIMKPSQFDILRAMWIDTAAITIQRYWRGHTGRKEARFNCRYKLWKLYASQKARIIQRAFRSFQDKCREEESQIYQSVAAKRLEAAIKIQSAYKKRLTKFAQQQEIILQILLRVRSLAAIEIQRVWRGYRTRHQREFYTKCYSSKYTECELSNYSGYAFNPNHSTITSHALARSHHFNGNHTNKVDNDEAAGSVSFNTCSRPSQILSQTTPSHTPSFHQNRRLQLYDNATMSGSSVSPKFLLLPYLKRAEDHTHCDEYAHQELNDNHHATFPLPAYEDVLRRKNWFTYDKLRPTIANSISTTPTTPCSHLTLLQEEEMTTSSCQWCKLIQHRHSAVVPSSTHHTSSMSIWRHQKKDCSDVSTPYRLLSRPRWS